MLDSYKVKVKSLTTSVSFSTPATLDVGPLVSSS